MNPYLMQKQIRDNAKELRGYLEELDNWEREMKRKDEELLDRSSENVAVPPVRSKIKRSKNADYNNKSSGIKEGKRIPSYDYSAWDKFDVEKACEDVDNEEKQPDSDDFESTGSLDRDSTNADEARLREQALYEKELGNKHVKGQRWKDAIECYTKAIQCNPYDAVFYANRALCYLKTKLPRLAETDCTTALQLDHTYVKAYQRRALARVDVGLIDDAKRDFQKVLELEPNNSAAESELSKLERWGQTSSNRKKDAVQKKLQKVVEKSKSPVQNVIEEKSFSVDSQKESAASRRRLEGVPDIPGAGGDAGTPETPNSTLREGDKDVTSLQKPPHLRSKRSMKVIPIKEVETFADLLEQCAKTEKKNHNNLRRKIVEINSAVSHGSDKTTEQIVTKKTEPVVKIKEHVKDGPSRLQESIKLPEEKTSGINIDLPSVPKTSVQFMVSWKIVKHYSEMRYQFLKQISGREFPQIFQESLESREFGEIINSLASEFLEKNEPVYSYLCGLSDVKRFSALVMFMSKTEKAVIKKLLQQCDKNNECTKEDLAELFKRYEVR